MGCQQEWIRWQRFWCPSQIWVERDLAAPDEVIRDSRASSSASPIAQLLCLIDILSVECLLDLLSYFLPREISLRLLARP